MQGGQKRATVENGNENRNVNQSRRINKNEIVIRSRNWKIALREH